MSAKKIDRTKIESAVKLRAYSIISDAVERGLQYGWGSVWKHRETMEEDDREAVLETLENAVLMELCEVLEFDPPNGR